MRGGGKHKDKKGKEREEEKWEPTRREQTEIEQES